MTEEQRIRIEEGQIDLIELFHVMLRKLWLIVICGVIGLCLLYTSDAADDPRTV